MHRSRLLATFALFLAQACDVGWEASDNPPDAGDGDVSEPDAGDSSVGDGDVSPDAGADSGEPPDCASAPNDPRCPPQGRCAEEGGHDCDTEPFACVSTDDAKGYECKCGPGYAGSGVGEDGCIDVDECAAGTDTCDQEPATACTNTPGAFTCGECPAGFTGDAASEQGCLPLLSALELNRGALTPAFDPMVTEYEVDLRPWENVVDLVPTADASFALKIDGSTATSGQAASTTVGSNGRVVQVTVEYGGATRVYTLNMKLSVPAGQYIKAPNRTTLDNFAYAISLSADGNTLAIGSPGEDSDTATINGLVNEASENAGAAYVYVRREGTWALQAFIKAFNATAQDDFGRSVDLSSDGNTLVVGATAEDSATTGVNSTPDEGAKDAGAAYVYRRTGETWAHEAYLKASNTSINDQYGMHVSVSGDGNTIAVGARLEDSSVGGINQTGNEMASNAGAAYVYIRTGASWTQQAYVKASHPSAGDRFGWNLELDGSGNTLLVGSPSEDSTNIAAGATPNEDALESGAAYVFTRSGATWTQQAYLKAKNAQADDGFGGQLGIASDGNTLAVSSLDDSSTTGINSTPNESAEKAGAVYVFARSGNAWTQQAYVKASNTGAGDAFGEEIAFSSDGNILAVGSYGESSADASDQTDDTASQAGAVYMFARVGGTWSQKHYLKSPYISSGDFFGDRVELSSDGRTLVVGAYAEDSSSASGEHPNENAIDSGAAYFF